MKKTVRRDGELGGYVSLHRIKVGSDPEFELVNPVNDDVLSAAGVIRGGTGPDVQIGVDGAGGPLEFRPHPAERPQSAVKEFKRLVKSFARYYPGYKLSYAGSVHAIGGHIHVSVDGHRFTETQMRDLSKVFDDFLGKFILPLSGVARGGYARLTGRFSGEGWREQPWGLEYRVPPAACFSSPTFLRLMYKGIKELTFRYMNQATMTYDDSPRPTDRDYKKYARFSQVEVTAFFAEIDRCQSEANDSKDLLAHWSVQMRERRARQRGSLRVGTPEERDYQRRMEHDRVEAERRVVTRREREALRHAAFGNVAVVYGDDWSEENMRTLTTHLSVQREWVTGSEIFSVELFGLAAHRGEVATLNVPMTGWNMIDNDAVVILRAGWVNRNTLRIGLPLIFRTETTGHHAAVARAIVDEIVRHLSEIA